MRLAYADPPYPGMADLYVEQTEVDHRVLLRRLDEYDGWALSTDERSLAFVLTLCPRGVRILAWCRSNAPFLYPNPAASWEPVICKPARIKPVTVRTYLVTAAPTGRSQREGLTGQKPPGFCEWVLRSLGADPEEDELHDLFPGTGVMSQTWRGFKAQRPLFKTPENGRSMQARANILRRTHPELDAFDGPPATNLPERATKVDRGRGARRPT
jgi:hypothetical protein